MYFKPMPKGDDKKKGSVIKELREKIVHIAPKVVHKLKEVVHEEKVVVHKASTKHGVYADLEKRKAYRREWMRRRRGKAES